MPMMQCVDRVPVSIPWADYINHQNKVLSFGAGWFVKVAISNKADMRPMVRVDVWKAPLSRDNSPTLAER